MPCVAVAAGLTGEAAYVKVRWGPDESKAYEEVPLLDIPAPNSIKEHRCFACGNPCQGSNKPRTKDVAAMNATFGTNKPWTQVKAFCCSSCVRNVLEHHNKGSQWRVGGAVLSILAKV